MGGFPLILSLFSIYLWASSECHTSHKTLIDSIYPACIDNKIPKELKDLEKAEGLARAKGIILFYK